jgi:dihydroorotate dehydrogenase
MNTTANPSAAAPRDALYALARAILFRMDPEKAHDCALQLAANPIIRKLNSTKYRTACTPIECMGLHLQNPIGLAAGLDKNGDYIDALAAMGFGFLEIGTVTPKAQDGNAKPRMFRLTEHEAIINRMGFNNYGVDHLVDKASKRQYRGVLGINIGKNASTPLERADDDYLHCLKKVYPVADYVTVNVSSPNTQGLRDLQHGDKLRSLLSTMKNNQSALSTEHGKYKPLLIKIAPDMTHEELTDFCLAVQEFEIDGVIAGNTTREREPVRTSPHADEDGGLSGKPLLTLANERLQFVAQALKGSKTALIGVGGVSNGDDAAQKRQLGADLVQLYTGLIYSGPALVRDCIRKTA